MTVLCLLMAIKEELHDVATVHNHPLLDIYLETRLRSRTYPWRQHM